MVLLSQDQPRPPVYNVEDYAGSLRKFGKRGSTSDGNNGDSQDAKETEMTLKEFTSITELLEKLSTDLKLAYFRYIPIIVILLLFTVGTGVARTRRAI